MSPAALPRPRTPASTRAEDPRPNALRVAATAVGWEPAATPDDRSRRTWLWPVLLAVAVGCAALVAGVVLATSGDDRPAGGDETRSEVGAEEMGAPRPLEPGESYVDSEIQANGDVVVRQWINADEPLQLLRLTLPVISTSGAVSASGIEVVVDGRATDGPARLTEGGATYSFSRTSQLELRYRLRGAVELGGSVPGRALAVATALDVEYAPRATSETRLVRAEGTVLALSCATPPAAALSPCGTAEGTHWQVDLAGPRVEDRVAAQLDVG